MSLGKIARCRYASPDAMPLLVAGCKAAFTLHTLLQCEQCEHKFDPDQLDADHINLDQFSP